MLISSGFIRLGMVGNLPVRGAARWCPLAPTRPTPSLVSHESATRLSGKPQVPSVRETVEKMLCAKDARASIVEAASKEQPRNTGAKVRADDDCGWRRFLREYLS